MSFLITIIKNSTQILIICLYKNNVIQYLISHPQIWEPNNFTIMFLSTGYPDNLGLCYIINNYSVID